MPITASSVDPVAKWTVAPECPADWPVLLKSCGGGFFHTPIGLLAGSPAGEQAVLALWKEHQCAGIAIGIRHKPHAGFLRRKLGLTKQPPELYFPTVPAFARGVSHKQAMRELHATLATSNISAVRFDSFDASWCAGEDTFGEAQPARTEHVLQLPNGPEAASQIFARCSSHHSRHIRRGDREGWTLRALDGEQATRLLGESLQSASERARKRGDGFTAALATIARYAKPEIEEPWGVNVWSVWDKKGPLAVAAIGHANRRAYYINGGSMPRGYERDASVWMQYRVSCTLAEANFVQYNLGGTTPGANAPEHRAHGLYRFKRGFGGSVSRCGGMRWQNTPDSSEHGDGPQRSLEGGEP